MSVFFRSSRPEQRAVTSIPWSHGGSSPSATGNDALNLIPVYSAVRLIADSVSTLPIQAGVKRPDGSRKPIDVPRVIADPSSNETRVSWVHRLMTSALLDGNAFGLIVQRDGVGKPSRVVWLDPAMVDVVDSSGGARFYFNGRELDRVDLIHIPAFTVAGQTRGVSPIGAAAAAVRSGMRAQEFTDDWFKNKTIPSSTFKNSAATLDAEQSEIVSERMAAKLRTGKPLVMGKDWDYDLLKISADDAGFIASSRATASQIASIFGVPPEMIGGDTGSSLTYSTVEQNTINFITYTLRPWLVKIEEAFTQAFMRPGEYVKFNVDAMIRTDLKTRHEVFQIDRNIGLKSIDELRALDDLEPLPSGAGEDFTPLSAPVAAPATSEPNRSMSDSEIRSLVSARSTEPSTINVHVDPPDVPVTVNVEQPDITVQPSRMTVMPAIERDNQSPPIVNVNVEPTPVHVEAPNVNIDAPVTVKPADVKVLPTGPKTRRIVRDAKGDITRVEES